MFDRSARRHDVRFLTVVTFGRTGSTALQAALNAHPGTLIRGENYLALHGLQSYIQSLAAAAGRHHAGRPDHPWFGTARLDAEAARASARRMFVEDVLRPKADTMWTGYKEVRYETGYFPDTDAVLDHLLFVSTLLPECRFLVNVRGADRAGASGWWPDNPLASDVLRDTIAHLREAAEDLARILGAGRVALVEYEQWSVDPDVLTRSLLSLGFPAEATRVADALATRLEHGRPGG